MTNHFSLGMTKVTELTKAGKLAEATALIQSLLGSAAPASDTPPASDIPPDSNIPTDGAVIEGVFTRLADDATADTASASASIPADNPAPLPPDPPQARTSLRETLRRIRAGGMPAATRVARPLAPLPEGARFLSLTHSGRQGQRDYKLYIPAAQAGTTLPLPLIVMLHGCTQSPDDFAAGTGMNALAETHGFLVAYPAQPAGANSSKCWNWFRPEDQSRDRGEPALIAGLTRDILRDHPVDPARIYIAGLSAGGAAAAIMAACYPELFTAVGVHSGLPVGAATDIPQAFSAMRSGARGTALTRPVPTIVIHGLADATVHPRNGSAVADRARQAFGDLAMTRRTAVSPGGRPFRHDSYGRGDGPSLVEHWVIDAAGHAWAGGQPEGSFTDPRGPKASEEMVRFFLQHRQVG